MKYRILELENGRFYPQRKTFIFGWVFFEDTTTDGKASWAAIEYARGFLSDIVIGKRYPTGELNPAWTYHDAVVKIHPFEE